VSKMARKLSINDSSNFIRNRARPTCFFGQPWRDVSRR
jgi:hypothetical protein